ncbi:RNA-guided pseudouridylation complex pseudouridine synthase subunit Cbf5 [Candidatus Pacearchaeota archaeon]|nr:RNA-guided pseudouridylation complex pseudouridine synthase subunit Cbf5 [Candidatus Pacearchaeota archaeon]
MKIDIEKIKQSKTISELLEFGILNIDKPSGPTSFSISDFVRKKLKLRKTSHFGTLDPKVTGVLPIALNRACKLTGYFIGEDKTYIGVMKIHEEISTEKIQEIINEKFLGIIKQTPPVKSRVARVEREREIKKFKILEKKEKDFLFEVSCQGGTYIRKLISDLGEELGVGAHMLELRRVEAGIFSESGDNIKYPSKNLYEFEKAIEDLENGNEDSLREIIIPGEIVSELYKNVEIKKDNLKQILTGKPLYKNDLISNPKNYEKKELVVVFSDKRFIGIYKIVNEEDLFAKPDFVFQPVGN